MSTQLANSAWANHDRVNGGCVYLILYVTILSTGLSFVHLTKVCSKEHTINHQLFSSVNHFESFLKKKNQKLQM